MERLLLTLLTAVLTVSPMVTTALLKLQSSKAGGEEDSIMQKIFAEIRGVNVKLSKLQGQVDGLEQRFNKSQEPTTTASWIWQKTMRIWTPATTTRSPEDMCTDKGGFLCYNASSICIPVAKLCDKVADCPDESDECFCSDNAPEQIVSRPKECPHGYYGSKTLRKCYYFSPAENGASWVEALMDCTRRRAQLVAIESRFEQDAVVRFLKSRTHYTNSSFWLGATNILRVSTSPYHFVTPNLNSQWKWLSNDLPFTNVSYTNWIKQPREQPDNSQNMEHCLEMRYDYTWQWNDKECKQANPYICEIAMPTGQRKFSDDVA